MMSCWAARLFPTFVMHVVSLAYSVLTVVGLVDEYCGADFANAAEAEEARRKAEIPALPDSGLAFGVLPAVRQDTQKHVGRGFHLHLSQFYRDWLGC